MSSKQLINKYKPQTTKAEVAITTKKKFRLLHQQITAMDTIFNFGFERKGHVLCL